MDFTLSRQTTKERPLGVKALREEFISPGRERWGGLPYEKAWVLFIPYRGRKSGFGSFKGVQHLKVYSGSFPGNF